jgi:pimeloyl-ACP methyl ester carboxylesterase
VKANVANPLLTEIAKDCQQALEEVKLNHSYHKLLLAGEGLGGTVAANLAAQHPGDYNHMVLLNPLLSLPALVLSRPGLLWQALPLRGTWFSGADLATAWASSPLSKVQNISSAALIVTSRRDTTKQAIVLKYIKI